MSTSPLPDGYTAGACLGYCVLKRVWRQSPYRSTALYLAPDEAHLLAGLLLAPNAAEIGAWLEGCAAALETGP